MNTVTLKLSSAQKTKYNKGHPFQLTAEKIQVPNGNVTIALTKTQYNRMLRNVHAGKGYRFSNYEKTGAMGGSVDMDDMDDLEETEGGKLRIGRAFKRMGRQVKKTANKTGKLANRAGVDIQKRYNSKKATTLKRMGTTALKTGLKLAGDFAVDRLEKEGFVNENQKKILKQGIHKGVDHIKGGALKKGSQEAKERMAKLRAMRNKGVVKSAVKSVKKTQAKPATISMNEVTTGGAVTLNDQEIPITHALPGRGPAAIRQKKARHGSGFKGYGEGFKGYGEGFKGYGISGSGFLVD